MYKKLFTPRFIMLSIMVLAAAATRFLPHYPNFTAIGAMALFGGAYFSNKKTAFLVPAAALLLTDLVLGFHVTMIAVYLSFALIVAIGFTLKNNKKPVTLFLASVSASVSFFIITNFAVWAMGPFYPKTGAGLAACFTAAIPFFHFNLLGDLLFMTILFGSFELMKVKFPRLAAVKA